MEAGVGPEDAYNGLVEAVNSGQVDAFGQVLAEEVADPVFLTAAEIQGGWRATFPKLAEGLPSPYPIFAEGDDAVVSRGYPVLLSEGVRQLRRNVERMVADEVAYRVARGDEREDRRRAALGRRRTYQKMVAAILESCLVNDYGRGLFDVFLLYHSSDVAEILAGVPQLVVAAGPTASATGRGKTPGDELRVALVDLVVDLLQQASETTLATLRGQPHLRVAGRISPLQSVLCQDQLLLLETTVSPDLRAISAYLRVRHGLDVSELLASLERAARSLAVVLAAQPELGAVLALATACDLDQPTPAMFLQPPVLDALDAAGLAPRLDLAPARRKTLRDLGLRLKAFELLAALRRRVVRLETTDSVLHLAGKPAATIAASTRPYDFASAGIVTSTVRRFGLVYDLTAFTETLGAVRRQGRREEERSLRFMYAFQERVEEIRARRRLTFEKFLGDGAFYSARRGERVLAAACEIQRLYDELTAAGFPFDQGLRIAVNYGSYQLLPLAAGTGPARFEFFGHGIVELARLTTGKSTREIEEIAEFLIHAGYESAQVDAFLAPLMHARGGSGERAPQRRYSVTLDHCGELVNEGVVLTLPFLHEVERQMSARTLWVAEASGLRWLVLEVDPGQPASLLVGLRYLGVARLKGLQPTELLEATVLTELPAAATAVAFTRPLITLLRRLATDDGRVTGSSDDTPIPADLVVISYYERNGQRRFIFGHYRASDDVILHAVAVPMEAAGLDATGSLEGWLFQNRHDLRQVYTGLRRTTGGASAPLSSLRGRPGYAACFLASPHRAPE